MVVVEGVVVIFAEVVLIIVVEEAVLAETVVVFGEFVVISKVEGLVFVEMVAVILGKTLVTDVFAGTAVVVVIFGRVVEVVSEVFVFAIAVEEVVSVFAKAVVFISIVGLVVVVVFKEIGGEEAATGWGVLNAAVVAFVVLMLIRFMGIAGLVVMMVVVFGRVVDVVGDVGVVEEMFVFDVFVVSPVVMMVAVVFL